ncbi:response regulator [Halomicrobium urmianum]|uniref:response regulator n=1 Tax=Halomicrobium urmianum TaxID=1586233 RepID=UPI001CD997ED|nr:response regulator [Halomicrobium urmianum]
MTPAKRTAPDAVDVLLIEANHGDVRLIRELFADAGIANDIHVVYDGDAALDFLHQRGEYADAPRPDIILLDLKLPGRKSEDVLATLRDRPELGSVPVLGMTSSPTEATIARASGIDVDACIHKPLDPTEFIDIVREMNEFGVTIVRKQPLEGMSN